MAKSILKGSVIIAPFAIVGTVLINVLNADRDTVVLFIYSLGVACGIVPFYVDEQLSQARREHRSRRAAS